MMEQTGVMDQLVPLFSGDACVAMLNLLETEK